MRGYSTRITEVKKFQDDRTAPRIFVRLIKRDYVTFGAAIKWERSLNVTLSALRDESQFSAVIIRCPVATGPSRVVENLLRKKSTFRAAFFPFAKD